MLKSSTCSSSKMSLFSTFIYLLVALLSSQNLDLVHSKHHKNDINNNGPPIKVTKRLSFPSFDPSNTQLQQDIKLLGSSKLSRQNHTLQIPDQSLRHVAGRALYSSPVRLFDPATRTPASFRTTFSFQFQNQPISVSGDGNNGNNDNNGGSGLAFLIVPDEFTVGRPGAWLAAMNDACDEDYKSVAVEFDTRFNPEFGDPSDNHVGIDLGNTVVSTVAENASKVGVFLNDGLVHRAWISYDGPNRSIDVRLGSDGGDYPAEPVFSGRVDVAPFLNEYMFVGFSASTGNHSVQIHSVLSWNFTSESDAFLRVPSTETCQSKIAVDGSGGELTKTKPPSSFLIFVAVVVLLAVAMVSFYCSGRRRRKGGSSASEEVDRFDLPEKRMRPIPPNKPRKFAFAEISAATGGFAESEILGGGDSRGVYYRGKLSNGCYVAVKRFSPRFLSSAGDGERLSKEVHDVSKLRHPHLVPIRGWCRERKRGVCSEFLVVYELFPNGSLDKWLFGAGVLPWTRRLKVVKDVAEALSFLHSKGLAHKNLKTSSVFLDVSFRACVGDFGFVLCGGESKRFESAVSQSADVFEFGLLVLEVVAGQRRSEERETGSLLERAWRSHEEREKARFVDKRMGRVLNSEQVGRVLDIGLLCTVNESKGRPNMEEVVELLSSERPVPELPPSRPVALFPYSSTNAGLCTGYSCASFK